MEFQGLHRWDVTPAEARALQDRLAPRVVIAPLPDRIELVAGADLAFNRARALVYAAVIVLRLPEMAEVERVELTAPCAFPYVPGLLTFREGPALLEAFGRLRHAPDAAIFDGQGLAHPRRFGLACHVGLWLGLPTVGCAKSRLIGEHAEPGPHRGDSTALLDGGERIGSVLRTREGVKPVYVSPGHMADFAGAERLVMRCCMRCRLPEPTRRAHLAVAAMKREGA